MLLNLDQKGSHKKCPTALKLLTSFVKSGLCFIFVTPFCTKFSNKYISSFFCINRELQDFFVMVGRAVFMGHFLSRGFFWIDLIFQKFFLQMYLLVVDIFFTILYSINIWRLSSVGRANGSYPLGRRFKPHSRYIEESITDSFFFAKINFYMNFNSSS